MLFDRMEDTDFPLVQGQYNTMRFNTDSDYSGVVRIDVTCWEWGLPGSYRFEVTDIIGTDAEITITCEDESNPYHGLTGLRSFDFGGDSYDNLAPGFSIGLGDYCNGNGDPVIGDAVNVIIGLHRGKIVVDPTADTEYVFISRHTVVNTNDDFVNSNNDTNTNCKARVLPRIHLYPVDSGPIYRADNSTWMRPLPYCDTDAVPKYSGNTLVPYHLSIQNISGSGTSKICDLYLDGVLVGAGALLNMQTGATVSGTGIHFPDAGFTSPYSFMYPYKFLTGPLKGMVFTMWVGTDTVSEGYVMVIPQNYIEIAPDNDGEPGDWGTADVVLTETGQSAGTITFGGEAHYWSRVKVPANVREVNPYIASVALEFDEVWSTSVDQWRG